MKLLKPLQAVALLCAVSCPAFAADVDYQTISDAAQKTGDLSRQVLVMIFGDVEPGQPTLIGSLFAMLCTVALVWFLVVTLKSRYQGQLDGQQLVTNSIAQLLYVLRDKTIIEP